MEIRVAANRQLASGETETSLAAAIMGEKAYRSMRAIRMLLDYEIDDQVCILGRAALEASIDLEYLLRPTTRGRRPSRGGPIALSSETKASLFHTHHDVGGERLFAPDAYPDVEDLEFARALRRNLGLPERSAYWHCSNTTGLISELEQSARNPDEAGHFNLRSRGFAYLSSFVHSHPHGTVYLARIAEEGSRWRLTDSFVSPIAPYLAGAGALDAALAWGTSAGVSGYRRASEITLASSAAFNAWLRSRGIELR